MDDETLEKKLPGAIQKLGKERAWYLVISTLVTRNPGKAIPNSTKKLILPKLEKGKTVYSECEEEYCEIFIDYDISGIKSLINPKDPG
ncbi:MAG: hypothetical protein GY754_04760 [bacterium]|nr:hypothetical protein [bacterium]